MTAFISDSSTYTIHACRKPYCPGSGILLSQKRHLQEKKELLYNQKKKEAVNKIRYGIISCASIVPRFAQGMELTETGTVCAIASRDPAKARKLAEELSIPKAYGDYQALLDDPDIDAVYIPLINSMHYPYAKKALLYRKACTDGKAVRHTQPGSGRTVHDCPGKETVLWRYGLYPRMYSLTTA